LRCSACAGKNELNFLEARPLRLASRSSHIRKQPRQGSQSLAQHSDGTKTQYGDGSNRWHRGKIRPRVGRKNQKQNSKNQKQQVPNPFQGRDYFVGRMHFVAHPFKLMAEREPSAARGQTIINSAGRHRESAARLCYGTRSIPLDVRAMANFTARKFRRQRRDSRSTTFSRTTSIRFARRQGGPIAMDAAMPDTSRTAAGR
jgi:hypothetical protein